MYGDAPAPALTAQQLLPSIPLPAFKVPVENQSLQQQPQSVQPAPNNDALLFNFQMSAPSGTCGV